MSVSATELVVVDLIARPWLFIRIPLLILGIWGLVFMLGMLLRMLYPAARASARTASGSAPGRRSTSHRPDRHRSVARRKHVVQEKQPRVIVDDMVKATLYLRMQNETNIEVNLV